jgi:hypothetical protein
LGRGRFSPAEFDAKQPAAHTKCAAGASPKPETAVAAKLLNLESAGHHRMRPGNAAIRVRRRSFGNVDGLSAVTIGFRSSNLLTQE